MEAFVILPYRKASEVLPEELVAEIHKYFRGGCLYVAHRKNVNRIKRDLTIIAMRREGRTVTEIAEWFLLSRRAVRNILQKAAARSAASPENIETSSSNTTRSHS